MRAVRLNRNISNLPGLDTAPIHISDHLWSTVPHYKHYPAYTQRSELTRDRSRKEQQAKTTYLSCATVVVVPATLISHWVSEIEKHAPILRTFIAGAYDPLPDALALASQFDVVLVSFERFAKEANWTATSVQGSALFRCRFRRLIVDEGNKLAGQSRVVDLAVGLNVDSRWMVSGTPTEMLVATGQSSDWSQVEQAGLHEASKESVSPSPLPSGAMLPWAKAEKKDVEERLFRLVVNFLRAHPFYDISLMDYGQTPLHWAKQRWSDFIVKRIFAPDRPPEMQGVSELFAVLCKTMVRNQPADVARDRPLPPLHRHYVPVVLSDTERKTFNVIQALIAANAALSEREGEDYFFHPSNRKWLIQIISNLSLACFHFASPDRLQQVNEAIALLTKRIDEVKWRDNQMLKDALKMLKEAADTQSWLEQTVDVSYRLAHIDRRLADAWSRTARSSSNVLTAVEMLDLQKALVGVIAGETPSDDNFDRFVTENLISMGLREQQMALAREQGRKAEEEELRQITAEYESSYRIFKGSQSKSRSKTESTTLSQEAAEIVKTNKALGRIGSSETASQQAERRRNKKAILSANVEPEDSRTFSDRLVLPNSSRFRQISLTSCSSTKLNKLIDMLGGNYAPTLIFSSLDNSLYEISALLDILSFSDARFRHRIFTSGVKQSLLDEYVWMFKEGNLDVLLIKTDKGARGLDLHRATRVIFVEPESSAAVERQAIKRAWRQGQQNAVDVYYLYAQDTFEEEITKAMQSRSHAPLGATSSDAVASTSTSTASVSMSLGKDHATEGGVVTLLKDPAMRDIVANPRYIEPLPIAKLAKDDNPAKLAFCFGLFSRTEASKETPELSNSTADTKVEVDEKPSQLSEATLPTELTLSTAQTGQRTTRGGRVTDTFPPGVAALKRSRPHEPREGHENGKSARRVRFA